ncbi:unnamed protein product [Ixodes hexagonus]
MSFLFQDFPLWLSSLEAHDPRLTRRDIVLLIQDRPTVLHRLGHLKNATSRVLALHLFLCAASDLVISESLKKNAGFNPTYACLNELRSLHSRRTWNNLVWYAVQPWISEIRVRHTFHVARRQLITALTGITDWSPTVEVLGALKRLSLEFPEMKNPDGNNSLEALKPMPEQYYVTRDRALSSLETTRREARALDDFADVEMRYRFGSFHLEITLGLLVPPLYRDDYSQDILLAGLGFWMLRTVVGSKEFPARASTEHCLLRQAELDPSGERRPELYGAALGFHVAYASFEDGPAKEHRKRLLFRFACSAFCGASFERGGVTAPQLCHATVANTPEFFALFRCDPEAAMAQAGVCTLL